MLENEEDAPRQHPDPELQRLAEEALELRNKSDALNIKLAALDQKMAEMHKRHAAKRYRKL